MAVAYRLAPPPAPAEQVQHLEHVIGERLPESYTAFLSEQDGGWLTENDQALKVIFGVGDVPDDLSMWRKLETFRDRVPSWLLPVAQDAYGNLFALSLRPEDRGTVWFWDHEGEADEGEPPTEDNLEVLAPDWDAFLRGLVPAVR